jgi:hypothetical protein
VNSPCPRGFSLYVRVRAMLRSLTSSGAAVAGSTDARAKTIEARVAARIAEV